MNARRFLMLVGCAFLLRAAFLLAVGPSPDKYQTNDSVGYLLLTKNLVSQRVFSQSDTVPLKIDTERTPGYPVFIAIVSALKNPNVILITWIQAILGAIAVGILFLTARSLGTDSLSASLIAFAMACDYVIIVYSSLIMTEALFLFLLVFMFYLFARFLEKPNERMGALLFSGFLSGVCTMVRPVSIYYFAIPLGIIGILGIRKNLRDAFQHAVLFVIAAALLPMGWMARNKAVSGSFTISTIQGLTRAVILEERLSNLTYPQACERVERLFRDEHPNPAPGADESIEKSLWASRYVLRHPKDYAIVLFQESIRLIAGNGMKASAWMFFKDRRYNPAEVEVHPKDSNFSQVSNLWARHKILGASLMIYLTYLGMLYLLALVGLFSAWHDHREIFFWLLGTAAYFFVVSIGFGTGARYRIPLMPSIFLFAGLGLAKLKSTVKNSKSYDAAL